MNHKQTILTVALLAQVLLLVLLKGTFSGSAEAGTVRPFLPELDGLVAARLTVENGEGGSVSLSLQSEGWTLDEADGYPVDDSKVDAMLEDLRGLKIRRPVVTASRYHAQLKVADDDHERRVRIWSDPAGDPEVDFLVGSSPNYRISDVRRQGEDEVYEVMGLSAFDVQADTASWIEKKVVDVPADQVTGLKITNSNGAFELARQDGVWTVVDGSPGGDLDQTAVESLVRAYSSIFLAEPVGKVDASHGLESPAAVVELIRGGPAAAAAPPGDLAALEDTDTAAPAGADADAPAGADPAAPVSAESAIALEDAEVTDTGLMTDAGTDSPALPSVPMQVTVLSVGANVDEEGGKRYATVSGLGFTVILNEFDADRATDKKLDDLMVSEPETE